MASEQDAELIDRNVVESIREFGRWQRDSMIVEEDGVLLVSGTTDSPVGYSNCAARVDPAAGAELVLERAQEFFEGEGRGFTLWVRGEADQDLESLALEKGLSRFSESNWMLRRGGDHRVELPAGVELRLVDDVAGIEAATSVNGEAYQSLGFAPEEARAMYGHPQRALGAHLITCVAFRDGAPIATAMALLSAGVAGIYWVGTVPDARRQGLAAACTLAVHDEAASRGAQLSTLQASQMGESMYAAIGYERCSFHRWMLQSG